FGVAQNFGVLPEIPRELLDSRTILDGDEITFCYYEHSINAALDMAVAEAIGSMLLLTTNLHSTSGPINVPGIDFIPIGIDDLFILLTNDCDAFMGFTLASGAYPE